MGVVLRAGDAVDSVFGAPGQRVSEREARCLQALPRLRTSVSLLRLVTPTNSGKSQHASRRAAQGDAAGGEDTAGCEYALIAADRPIQPFRASRFGDG